MHVTEDDLERGYRILHLYRQGAVHKPVSLYAALPPVSVEECVSRLMLGESGLLVGDTYMLAERVFTQVSDIVRAQAPLLGFTVIARRNGLTIKESGGQLDCCVESQLEAYSRGRELYFRL